MKYNQEQVFMGLKNYANDEVIAKLPTIGKWVIGAGVDIAEDRKAEIMEYVNNNAMLHTLGIVDDNGMIDIDDMAEHLQASANRYGKAYIELPIIGKIAFGPEDVRKLHEHIAMM